MMTYPMAHLRPGSRMSAGAARAAGFGLGAAAPGGTRLWQGLRHLHRQVDKDLGAPAGTGQELKPAAEFGDHERAHDLQPEAGRRVKIESFRPARAVVGDHDRKPLSPTPPRHLD